MKTQTQLSPRDYLAAMKERMGSRFSFGAERFTGFFMGRFFLVTHHAGYEWNRRITNQKNAALGYVKRTENGCESRFFHFQGMLCPQYLLVYLLCFTAYLVITWPVLAEITGVLIGTILIIVGMPPVITFFESLTEGSMEGRKSLLGLLFDPSDYFSYLKHQTEIDRF